MKSLFLIQKELFTVTSKNLSNYFYFVKVINAVVLVYCRVIFSFQILTTIATLIVVAMMKIIVAVPLTKYY